MSRLIGLFLLLVGIVLSALTGLALYPQMTTEVLGAAVEVPVVLDSGEAWKYCLLAIVAFGFASLSFGVARVASNL